MLAPLRGAGVSSSWGEYYLCTVKRFFNVCAVKSFFLCVRSAAQLTERDYFMNDDDDDRGRRFAAQLL